MGKSLLTGRKEQIFWTSSVAREYSSQDLLFLCQLWFINPYTLKKETIKRQIKMIIKKIIKRQKDNKNLNQTNKKH